MRSRILSLAFLILLFPSGASAQLMGTAGGSGQSPFTISVSPQYPSPNSKATLRFLSDTNDLSNATLSVSVAGKSIYQGSVQPVSVPLGKAGVPATAIATLTTNGAKYNQSVTINPQDVSIVVEPISSAPPLYPGKPRVPLEGSVRVVAIAGLRTAQGKVLSPNDVSYLWTVDDTRIADASGIGKAAILVASPLQYRNRTVSVAVTSQDGTLVGGASVSLAPENALVRIYENDPLLGVRYDHALLGSFSIQNAESTLYAAPFSLPTSSGAPSIHWFLNGSPAQTGTAITLRPSGAGSGNASLSVVASAGDYDTATANISLIFGKKAGTSFFGL